jgi:DNA invertase Pin-like site-specific DNA recombinase
MRASECRLLARLYGPAARCKRSSLRGQNGPRPRNNYLRSLGVELVPTSAPDFFTTDTPTAVLVRQVLGAISQFEKASPVAKLRAARERKVAAGGRGSGRFTYAQKVPEVVGLVRELHGQRQSLRQISKRLAAQGHLTGGGKPYTATAVRKMLRGG